MATAAVLNQPGLYRHCQSIPGTVIPRGFLIDWNENGNYVATRAVRVGPDGHATVPVELEEVAPCRES